MARMDQPEQSTPGPAGPDEASSASFIRFPSFWSGLSGKVLTLTILFVMLGEVLIFVPSVASFRITWLKNQIATAELAALAAEASPDGRVSEELRDKLRDVTGLNVLVVKRAGSRRLILFGDTSTVIRDLIDLRTANVLNSIPAAFVTLFRTEDWQIAVQDVPPKGTVDLIELNMSEKALRQAMIDYTGRILIWSLVLCGIVATFVFLAINRVLVQPIRRMSGNMLEFASEPEDASRIITPSRRRDELGLAEEQLAHMQTELTGLLHQKTRLAELGLAVSKISHDLRNMLSSAQLISDRLALVDDPTVQRFAPKLLASLDRAIEFCAQTLKFGQAKEAPPRREMLCLHSLVEEVIETTINQAPGTIVLFNQVEKGLEIDADRDHLFRILNNIIRNAAQALEQSLKNGLISGEGHVFVKGDRDDSVTKICIRDNGPGVPDKAKEHMFQAFKGSVRAGGTGLGLSISNELARAHGGSIRLIENTTDEIGAAFEIIIPDRVSEVKYGIRGKRDQRAVS